MVVANLISWKKPGLNGTQFCQCENFEWGIQVYNAVYYSTIHKEKMVIFLGEHKTIHGAVGITKLFTVKKGKSQN